MNKNTMNKKFRSRRQILRAGGIATVAAVTGCIGGDDGTGAGPGDGSGGPEATEFNPTDCEPRTVSDDIQEDTTWSPEECPRVALDGNVRVTDGATLTIEPGVEVVGKSGSRITVRDGGTLKATGESTNPVWFYGESDSTGFWEGIRFRSETENELDNVIVRNGGQGDWSNIYLDDSSTVSVTNTLSERCSTSGMIATSGTTLSEFSNNHFRDNESAAVRIPTSLVGSVDSGSVYAGDNADDVIHVSDADIEEDTTWPVTDAPYRFEGSNHRVTGAAVTVEPGASFVFESGGRITVRDGGSFAAEGESDAPITFEGETATTGFWEGIRLRSNNPNNSFDHVEISHGGQGDWANIYLDDDSQASITNTQSSECSTSGMIATGGTTLREFASNTFEENEFAAIRIPTSLVGSVDADSTYTGGNEHDAVYVSDADVEEDTTWSEAPYRFEGSNHRVTGAAVTVEPGAEFTFEEGGRITVRDGGSFAAEGESDAPITFEGATDTRGFWEGIRLRANNPNNSFDNVEVANGGQGGWANIYLDDDSQASVTNSTLRASATYGIIVTSGASLDASNNTFENNAEGDIDNQNS